VKIRLADGTERTFISRSHLREVLDLDNEQTFRAARDLLVEVGLLKPHRRNHSPAHGFLLPPEWQAEHVLHLHRRARTLLREAGHVEDGGGRIRIFAL
jgi:hypothetical protein